MTAGAILDGARAPRGTIASTSVRVRGGVMCCCFAFSGTALACRALSLPSPPTSLALFAGRDERDDCRVRVEKKKKERRSKAQTIYERYVVEKVFSTYRFMLQRIIDLFVRTNRDTFLCRAKKDPAKLIGPPGRENFVVTWYSTTTRRHVERETTGTNHHHPPSQKI